MDIKRLKHLVALAEEGRFVQAAERVHLSQAAFSRSIQALEEQLGLRLVDRGIDGVRLTAGGEQVLARARSLLFEADCLQGDIELIKSGDVGEICFGAAPAPCYAILPDLLGRLHEQSPHLVVKVRTGALPALLEQLDAQQVDFCLGDPRTVALDQRYAIDPLSPLGAGLYCRKGHPLARQGKLDVAAMRRYGIAMISMPLALRDAVARRLGFAGAHELPQAVECDDLHVLARMTANTDVIGMLPGMMLAQERRGLHPLRTGQGLLFAAQVHAIWLKGRTLAPAALRAIQLARDIAAQV